MLLKSIETTPNPNSMKLNLDESFEKSVTYTKSDIGQCPHSLDTILKIEGLQSIFVCSNFITLNKDPRCDWKPILDEARHLLSGGGTAPEPKLSSERPAVETLGQAAVLVQTFRGIPIQVKVTNAEGEKRIALEARFSEAAQLVQAQTGADYLKERYWADWGVRYGTLEDVAGEIVDEITGSMDANKISSLIEKALNRKDEQTTDRALNAIQADLNADDWHKRLAAVQDLSTSPEAVPLLIVALKDVHPQVRRLSAAALGVSGSANAVAPLADALVEDTSVAVRRTAGDALSDIGDVSAQSSVCKALADPNKLVRWRAARFLNDVGTLEALPFLKQASDDPEFEVRLEIQAAIERISGGKEGSMPAWKKILKNTESR